MNEYFKTNPLTNFNNLANKVKVIVNKKTLFVACKILLVHV